MRTVALGFGPALVCLCPVLAAHGWAAGGRNALPPLEWGPPGYDNRAGRAFGLRHSTEPGYAELWVDLGSVYNQDVASAVFAGDGRKEQSSACWKAQRHITAPWACRFPVGVLVRLEGPGRVLVKSRSGKLLAGERTDFDRVAQWAQENILSRGEGYLACGCGCCPEVKPVVECLDPAGSGALERIRRLDRKAAKDPRCPVAGCSRGTLHVPCGSKEGR